MLRLLVLLSLAVGGCAGGASGFTPDDGDSAPEICNDLIDNDGDFAVDCDDIDCAGQNGCVARPDTEKDCVNNVDDDGDGATDCNDSDCANVGACREPEREVCGDGADNDLNGLIDCADPECSGRPECQQAEPEDCANGRDDDADGKIDCDDSDCVRDPACAQSREDCGNGRDDDGDGLADCDDADCAAVCGGDAEDCDNGRDDDNDGQTDCDDGDCASDPACREPPEQENCTDGRDNDGDGRADCDDPDCTRDPACEDDPDPDPENCTDGRDNDQDGRTDCDDPDCAADPACQPDPDPEDCDDNEDNDLDGDTDCADSDCAADPACVMEGGPGSCEDPLSARVGVNSGTTNGGSDDASPGCSLGENGLDAVYTVTFPQATTVCASTNGTTFDTVLYVQTTCGSEDAEVVCDDDGGDGLQSTVEFQAIAGTPYFLVVDGYSNNHSGDYTLTISEGACEGDQPTDVCDEPIFVGEGLHTANNTGNAANHQGSCGGEDGAEVVFWFMTEGDTTVCANSNDTDYDTVMYVREADCAGGSEVACDDDGGDVLASQVQWAATAGTEYYIFVDAYDERGTGDLNLSVSLGDCP